MSLATHFAHAFTWHRLGDSRVPLALAAAIGMGGPVFLGAATHHLELALIGCVGSLGVAGEWPGSKQGRAAIELATTLATVLLASVSAVVAGASGEFAAPATIAVCASAAAISSVTRRLAQAAPRFIIFTLIAASASSATHGTSDRLGLLALITASAAWSALTTLAVLRALARSSASEENSDASAQATLGQKLTRWWRSLRTFSGCQYALRILIGLAAAALIAARWPDHHFAWIGITVAILTPRGVDATSVRMTQRVLGTLLGVVLSGAIVGAAPSAWVLVLVVTLLAAARQYLRTHSYLLYSAVMVPLIVLMMESQRAVAVSVLFDRVVATVIGALLVLTLDLAAARATVRDL
jgi:hypothetical protein